MKYRRLISLFLVLTLMFGVSVIPVFAEDGSSNGPTVEDGVYFISSKKSGNQLMVQDLAIDENANVIHCAVNLKTDYWAAWKITYVGYGFYTIRPMHKLNMALTGLMGDVVIQNIGTIDSFDYLSEAHPEALWTIEEDDLGLVIMNIGVTELTLYAENAFKEMYPDTLLADYESEIPHCHWELQKVENPQSGTIMYRDGKMVLSVELALLKGQTIELSSVGIVPTAYSGNTISQEFYWTSSAPDMIAVHPATGAVTALVNSQIDEHNVPVRISGVSASGDTISFVVRIMYAVTLGSESLYGDDREQSIILGQSAQSGWSKLGYDALYISDIDADIIKDEIASADIVFLMSHGLQHKLIIQNKLCLLDKTCSVTNDSLLIADLDFSNTKLCVVNACYAASRYDGYMNVCRDIHTAGAECVLGWANEIYNQDAIRWNQRFQDKLAEGYTVEMAVRYANSFLYDAYLPQACNICKERMITGQSIDPECTGCRAIWNHPQYMDYSFIKNNRILGNRQLVISTEPADSIHFGEGYIDFVAEGIEYDCEFRTEGSGFDLDTFEMVLSLFDRTESSSMYKAVYTPTGDGYANYVLDFIFIQYGSSYGDYTGQLYGYTVIVENNRIVGVRDNRYTTGN